MAFHSLLQPLSKYPQAARIKPAKVWPTPDIVPCLNRCHLTLIRQVWREAQQPFQHGRRCISKIWRRERGASICRRWVVTGCHELGRGCQSMVPRLVRLLDVAMEMTQTGFLDPFPSISTTPPTKCQTYFSTNSMPTMIWSTSLTQELFASPPPILNRIGPRWPSVGL